ESSTEDESTNVTSPPSSSMNAIVVDVRPSSHFQIAHLPHALNWPFEELCETLSIIKKGYTDLIKNIVKHHPVYTALTQSRKDASSSLTPPPSSEMIPLTLILVCRRGNDSSIATQKLVEMLEKEERDVETLSPFLKIKFLNLLKGYQGLQQTYFKTFPFI
ncbi:hypothetical protein IE077_003458, partial [Cardiosporidium cionae]